MSAPGVLALCCCILGLVGATSRIHERMTEEELRQVFRTKRAAVPHYELASVDHKYLNTKLKHRTTPKNVVKPEIRMYAFGMDLKFYLEPNDGMLASADMPMWYAESNNQALGGIHYTRITNIPNYESYHLYQDPRSMAALTVRVDKDEKMLIEGTFGNGYVIRPLPKRFWQEDPNYLNHTRPKRDLKDQNLDVSHYHVVYRNPVNDVYKSHENRVVEGTNIQGSKRSKRQTSQVPEIVYPQVLVILDEDYFRDLPEAEARLYVLSFWNAVDLRYRIFSSPKVRLNVAGIIIPRGQEKLPYMRRHLRLDYWGRKTLLLEGPMLNDKASYFYEELFVYKRFVLERDYNIVFTMTSLNLCDEGVGRPICAPLGIAFRSGGCSVMPQKGFITSMGVIEDNSGFAGINSAAHELAHVFNATHDTVQDWTRDCKQGNLMSFDVRYQVQDGFTWSECSVESVHKFLNSEVGQCLYAPPKMSKALPRALPGELLSADEQCRKHGASMACDIEFSQELVYRPPRLIFPLTGEAKASVCQHLRCYHEQTRVCHTTEHPAAEGTECGNNKFCINGKCIARNSEKLTLRIEPRRPQQPIYPLQNTIQFITS